MLIDSLIYGTARLTGGASARASRKLVESCRHLGICRFDTAPSYGLGTAEALLGQVLSDDPRVRVTTKVGLKHPSYASMRTYGRAFKNWLVPSARAQGVSRDKTPKNERDRDASGHFSKTFMESSLERSLYALRRQHVDMLLLHESYEEHATIENISWLEEQKSLKRCTQVGFSNGLLYSDAARRLFPGHFVSQTAVPPQWLMRFPGKSFGDLNLHSIASAGAYLYKSDSEFQALFASASRILRAFDIDTMTQVMATSFALTHAKLPNAGLVFSSIDSGRLIAFLEAIQVIDVEIGNDRFMEEIGISN